MSVAMVVFVESHHSNAGKVLSGQVYPDRHVI